MQERLPRSSARQAFSLFDRLVVAVVADAALDLGDRVPGQPQRVLAMTAFVALRFFQLRASEPQMFERRLHARLVGAGPSGYKSRGDGGDDEQGDDETMQFHGLLLHSESTFEDFG